MYVCMCVHVCMYICMLCVCMCVYICMCVYVCGVYVVVCMRACMYVCHHGGTFPSCIHIPDCRQNEVGTPYCIFADQSTLESGIVALQDRDTVVQVPCPQACPGFTSAWVYASI